MRFVNPKFLIFQILLLCFLIFLPGRTGQKKAEQRLPAFHHVTHRRFRPTQNESGGQTGQMQLYPVLPGDQGVRWR